MPYKDIEQQRAAQLRYRNRNLEKVRATTRDRRNLIVKYAQAYKEERGCADCKIMYPHWILEFDHLPEFTKVANVSMMIGNYSLDAVKDEIAKCEVVCANCHRDRSHDRLTK